MRRVVGQQLRVDVELADAARDELRELAAEVEDDDGVRAPAAASRPAGGRRACARGRARRARPRDTPRPRRRRGPGRGGPRWRARRGRSCRAAGSASASVPAAGCCSSAVSVNDPSPRELRWCMQSLAARAPARCPMTYSIVALDPATGELGVAVAEPLVRRRQRRAVGRAGRRRRRDPVVHRDRPRAQRPAADARRAHRAGGARRGPGRRTRVKPCARSGWSTRRRRRGAHRAALRPVRLASRRRRRGRAGQHDGALDRAGGDAGGVHAGREATLRHACSRRWLPPRARAATSGAASPRRSWSRRGRVRARARPAGRGRGASTCGSTTIVRRWTSWPGCCGGARLRGDGRGRGGRRRGDVAAAAAASERSIALAPDDDQVRLWHARRPGARRAGRRGARRARAGDRARSRGPASTSAGSPRPGHLPGGEATLRALGLD